MLYLLMSLGIFGLDMHIKEYIEKHKELGYREVTPGNKVILQRVHNRGAMLNFLQQRQPLVAKFSLGLSVLIIIYYLYTLGQKGKMLLKMGLSFVVGGACSNVYDRVKRKYVVDYFSFNVKWEKLRSVVFNLADIFIFIGSALTFIARIGLQKEKKS